MSYANRSRMLFGLLLVVLMLPACNRDEPTNNEPSMAGDEAGQKAQKTTQETAGQMSDLADAVAILKPTSGNSASGSVRFTSANRGLGVEAKLTGLSPGRHGFHIHANGDCSAPDASSAGGHYDPESAEHGGPDDETHHTGDLGNVQADDEGRATLDRNFPFLTLEGEKSIVGKAIVVHAGEDDLESQPSGDAGARVACGVIRSGGLGQ